MIEEFHAELRAMREDTAVLRETVAWLAAEISRPHADVMHAIGCVDEKVDCLRVEVAQLAVRGERVVHDATYLETRIKELESAVTRAKGAMAAIALIITLCGTILSVVLR